MTSIVPSLPHILSPPCGCQHGASSFFNVTDTALCRARESCALYLAKNLTRGSLGTIILGSCELSKLSTASPRTPRSCRVGSCSAPKLSPRRPRLLAPSIYGLGRVHIAWTGASDRHWRCLPAPHRLPNWIPPEK